MAVRKEVTPVTNLDGVITELIFQSLATSVYMSDGETNIAQYMETFISNALSGLVSKEELAESIQKIIGAAPEAFDTLEEIAAWIEEHQDLYKGLITTLSNKVDKETGKGLSTEDFTTALKTKLESLENYQHPAAHSADMIEETANKQFVTAAEKELIQSAGTLRSGTEIPSDLKPGEIFLLIK